MRFCKIIYIVILCFFLSSRGLKAQTGNYLSLNGSTNYMLVQDHDDLDIDAGESYTITCQLKTNTFKNSPLIRKRNGTGIGYELITGSTGNYAVNLRSTTATPGTVASTDLMSAGNWHHFAMVINTSDNTCKVYINGVLQLTSTNAAIGAESFANNIDLYIGHNVSQARYFNGQMDDIRFWSKAMTQAEVQADRTNIVNGSQANLIAAWDFENIIGDEVPDVSGNGHNGKLVGYPLAISFSSVPQNMHFYARDSQDSAAVNIEGKVIVAGIDSVKVDFFRDNNYLKTVSQKVNYSSGTAPFNLSGKIKSELAQYKIIVKTVASNGDISNIVSRDKILCGDAFVIMGQSNSHPTRVGETYTNEFLRSFGIQTANTNYATYNPADTLWGAANADQITGVNYFSGPYSVGVWGLVMMDSLMKKFNVPVCIINGGAGSSDIEENLPLANHLDLTSVYGRMLYRVQKSGLQNSIKGLFWHQGEKNANATFANYPTNFNTLYNAWKTDLPNLSRVYVFQTNLNGCYGAASVNQSKMREFQRTLPDVYPDIKVIPSAGIPGMQDGDGNEIPWCHYGLQGYRVMGEMTFYIIAKDLYGYNYSTNSMPPNIVKAFYSKPDHTQLKLVFDNEDLKWPESLGSHHLKDYFYFDETQYGNIVAVTVKSDTLVFDLAGTTTATTISYLPNRNYNGTTQVFAGPYLTNMINVGALTFHNFPIQNFDVVLPVTWLNIDAEKQRDGVLIKWNVAEEINMNEYHIERSNGYDWEKLGVIKAKSVNSAGNTYQFKDIVPLAGVNYYQIKQLDNDGKYSYSKTVTLNFKLSIAGFSVYPNPVEHKIVINISDEVSEKILLFKIISANGQLLRSEDKDIVNNRIVELTDLQSLPQGIHVLNIESLSGKILQTHKIIKK